MNRKLVIVLISLIWASNGYGQGSNVPDSVRAMIERSQAATQFEQTARIQVNLKFGDFLNTLASDPQRKNRIQAALVEVFSERVQLSSRVVSGQASSAELTAVSDYAYLRARIEPLLNAAELSVLDGQRSGPSDEQRKKDYAQELSRTAGGLSEANRELVLDTVIKHIRMAEDAAAEPGQLSVSDLVNQQSRSLMAARADLQSQLTGDQLEQANAFLSQLQANLAMNRAMTDEPQ